VVRPRPPKRLSHAITPHPAPEALNPLKHNRRFQNVTCEAAFFLAKCSVASRPFPGFESFFVLEGCPTLRQFHARIELSVADGFAILRAELQAKAPVNACWMMGHTRPRDLVYTTSVAPTLISDRVVSSSTRAGATGWSIYAVRLHGRSNEPILGYHGLSVHGRCGPLQRERARWIKRQFFAGMFPMRQGYYFDEQSWTARMYLSRTTERDSYS
jgi:hypothetical protein